MILNENSLEIRKKKQKFQFLLRSTYVNKLRAQNNLFQ